MPKDPVKRKSTTSTKRKVRGEDDAQAACEALDHQEDEDDLEAEPKARRAFSQDSKALPLVKQSTSSQKGKHLQRSLAANFTCKGSNSDSLQQLMDQAKISLRHNINEIDPPQGFSTMEINSASMNVARNGMPWVVKFVLNPAMGSTFPHRMDVVGFQHDDVAHISYPIVDIYILIPSQEEGSCVTPIDQLGDSDAPVAPGLVDPLNPPSGWCLFTVKSGVVLRNPVADPITHRHLNPVAHMRRQERDFLEPVADTIVCPQTSTGSFAGTVRVLEFYERPSLPLPAHRSMRSGRAGSNPASSVAMGGEDLFSVPNIYSCSVESLTLQLEAKHLSFRKYGDASRQQLVELMYPSTIAANCQASRESLANWRKWPSGRHSIVVGYRIPVKRVFLRFEYDDKGRRDRPVYQWVLLADDDIFNPFPAQNLPTTYFPSPVDKWLTPDPFHPDVEFGDWRKYAVKDTFLGLTTSYFRRGPLENDRSSVTQVVSRF